MTLVTGTSGVEANVVVVMPFLMFVFPTRITRTPFASSTRSRSGNASAGVRDEDGRALSACSGSVGVLARALPTIEPAGQLAGLAANVACSARFL